MANNSSLTDNFVKALSYYLALSGKSKKEVADGIGIPPTTFSSWSNGKHLPDMDRLQNLATYLGAPVSEFFDFTANTSTPDPLLTELTDIFSELSTEDYSSGEPVLYRLALSFYSATSIFLKLLVISVKKLGSVAHSHAL